MLCKSKYDFMIAYRLRCSECNKEEVYIHKNTYSGRSPKSVVERAQNRHIRNTDHATQKSISISKGSWNEWHEEFVEEE